MAGAQQDTVLAFFTLMENQGGIIVPGLPKLDLEAYINNYKGRTRFERLLTIGACSSILCIDALKAAVAEAKAGRDVQSYRDAVEYLKVAAPNEPEAQFDEGWVGKTQQSNQQETARLEAELKGYKNNLIKESIRIGHRDLGMHLESIGELNAASDVYIKMRPDASTPSHILDVAKNTIRILIQKRDWAAVLANTGKLMASSTIGDENAKAVQPYMKLVTGLSHLGSGKYYEAARNFLDINGTILGDHRDIMSPNDVAIHGGLVALASMDRPELQLRVLDNPTFRFYLEMEPHIRKAVSMFVNGRYSACLAILESYRADYLLDIYLQRHVESLFMQIRSKCIVQYFLPFSCVTLDSLSRSFAKEGESLDRELVAMIQRGDLKARINTIDRLLVAVSNDPREMMQSNALNMARWYEKDALERIRRMSLAAADLEVKGNPRGRVPGSGIAASTEMLLDERRRAADVPRDEDSWMA